MFGKMADCMPSHGTLGCLQDFDFQADALLLLQIVDHRKQVTRPGVPCRTEHTLETLA